MENQVILSNDNRQSEKSVIIYRSEDGTIQLEVQLHEETVWLTQAQMAILFETTRNNITIHIGNLFREGELDKISVCKDSLLTASDGKPYKTKIYNLDVIISVGYRVKSKRGTDFRKWANIERPRQKDVRVLKIEYREREDFVLSAVGRARLRV